MTTGTFSWNVGKLFSEIKLVPDNLFIYAEANWEATERNATLLIKEALHIRLTNLELINRDEGVAIPECW